MTAVRTQRVPDTWPVLHLEREPAAVDALTVQGLVRHPVRLTLGDLGALDVAEHDIAIHCVWGWSRPTVRWTGVRLGDVLEVAGVEDEGEFVVVGSASDTYSSCLPIGQARQGVLAWARDGEPLSPEAGGPLRYIGPPAFWAYKGVKWACEVRVIDRFTPGFWESKVADPFGLIPDEVVLP